MGYTKYLMEVEEERRDVATTILVDASVLEHCVLHGNLLDNFGDIVEAYKSAAARFKNRQMNYDYALDCFDSQMDLTDTIKDVYENDLIPIDCPRCEALEDE